MNYVLLNNGIKMPIFGFGVYQIPKELTKSAVIDAIKVGYRHIDTAQGYKNEKEVGEAIKECGISRDKLFITTKIWVDNFGYSKTKDSFEESLKRLQTTYLDLVLIHHPFSDYYGTYKALEEYYEQGKIKAIGVSNFYPDRLADLIAFNKIKPQVNQIEINPFYQRKSEIFFMEQNNVQVEAWAPFAEGKNKIFSNPILVSIGNKYHKSPAQVILRWLIEQNIVVVSKTTHLERMKENFNIFDFKLDSNDMELIKSLDLNQSQFFYDNTVEGVNRMLEVIKIRRTQED